ncbi:MAG: DNA-binding protein [Deltaproteobacteria bacterium]|nr:MAG: DNA-binding protein [Deltaproteobacteria bacterium]
MTKGPEEWMRQAEYDLDTANYMFGGGRFFYTVFMCHLSIEKALKGIYQKRFNKIPPKTHNLLYLVEKVGLILPNDLYDFVFMLNRVSIPTRYPDDLQKMIRTYTKEKTKGILENSKELLKWLRTKL